MTGNLPKPPNWKRLQSGDLDWSVFQLRARVNRSIRAFFQSRKYLEIEAPLLTPYPTLDVNITSIDAAVHAERKSRLCFLHTSPEHAMKKLLAGGAQRIYALGKVFRDGEVTRLHNPEFTLLEWYQSGADYRDIADETETLIKQAAREIHPDLQFKYQGKDLDLSGSWERVTIHDLFRRKADIDLAECETIEEFRHAAQSAGMRCKPDEDWDTLFFRIFLERIEPDLGVPAPVFVMDYPAHMGMMARRRADNPEIAERVELYIGGLELANGYSELLDSEEQRQRFHLEQSNKMEAGFANLPIDEELLSALDTIPRECAGIALGVDRLIMLLADADDIQNVLPFPFHQWL